MRGLVSVYVIVFTFMLYVMLQLQSSWQQLQSNQVNVGSQMQCLTEEMSVMQTAKDQV